MWPVCHRIGKAGRAPGTIRVEDGFLRFVDRTSTPDLAEELGGITLTAEGLGMGWVSLVDPDHLSESVPLPEGARPLAYLCLGHPALDLKEPLLQTLGWDRRSPLPVDWI